MLGAREIFVFGSICYISGLKFWTEGIDVEEWVLSMVYLGCWLSVHTLESLVAYGW